MKAACGRAGVKVLKEKSESVLHIECPFDPSHGKHGGDTAVGCVNGVLFFKCMHDSCRDNHWPQFVAQTSLVWADGESASTGVGGEGKESRIDALRGLLDASLGDVKFAVDAGRNLYYFNDGRYRPAHASSSNSDSGDYCKTTRSPSTTGNPWWRNSTAAPALPHPRWT